MSVAGERLPLALVVAMGENGVIGKDGALPWRLSTDFKFFRRITMGKPVVMGRRTLDSLTEPLDGRDNIVLTRNEDFRFEGAEIAHGLDEALELAERLGRARGAAEISVIGGAEIFREVLPGSSIIHLTEVHAAPDGDTYFPPFDRSEWREVWRERIDPGPKDDHAMSFVRLERRQPARSATLRAESYSPITP